MASPFPGMDPYVEGEMWQEFHETLANALRADVMPLLAPKAMSACWIIARRSRLRR